MTPAETVEAIKSLHGVLYTLRSSSNHKEADLVLKKIMALISRL
jgi:hypothetical protein